MKEKNFNIGSVKVGLDAPFFVIAGPCVIENIDICMGIAEKLVEIQNHTGIPIIFKASFDKANRSSIESFRGPQLEDGMEVLRCVKNTTHLPILTDVHSVEQVRQIGRAYGDVVDCLQIPAFLCRQTDLIAAVACSCFSVNIKKGQFMAPQQMRDVIKKVQAFDNFEVMITERGTFFGYNRLVNDMPAIEEMKEFGCPIVFDATHSCQLPGEGGKGWAAPILARAATAAGANGLFLEVHPHPELSYSDASTIMQIDEVEDLLIQCREIYNIVRR